VSWLTLIIVTYEYFWLFVQLKKKVTFVTDERGSCVGESMCPWVILLRQYFVTFVSVVIIFKKLSLTLVIICSIRTVNRMKWRFRLSLYLCDSVFFNAHSLLHLPFAWFHTQNLHLSHRVHLVLCIPYDSHSKPWLSVKGANNWVLCKGELSYVWSTIWYLKHKWHWF
jgi:hypothetical protein